MSNKLNHIAFIMDGNNRWSKKNSISKYNGYKTGGKTLINLTNYIFSNTEANFVSAFALSKNNMKRSENLINILKKVLLEFLNKELDNSSDNKFNIRFLGDRNFLNKEINDKINSLENLKNNSKKYLLIFLNYSGKKEIINAFRSNKNKKKIFTDYLLTNKYPDPDILIRTGGFKRLSDFLTFQTTFTELFFSNKLWPDLKKKDLSSIFNKYYLTERKFGR